jgi:lambda repressor-like predicted transcriptional regulator
MHSNTIHALLKSAGLTWSAAAEAIGCSRSALCNVAARRTESRHVALSLALLLGQDVKDVFPDKPRYAKPSRSEAHQAMVAAARERLAAPQALLPPATRTG